MTTRRNFLGSILAAGMAPAIVKAEILMPVRKIILPSPLSCGEIGQLYGVSFVVQDHVLDAQRYFNSMSRELMDRLLIVHHSQYEDLMKGRP